MKNLYSLFFMLIVVLIVSSCEDDEGMMSNGNDQNQFVLNDNTFQTSNAYIIRSELFPGSFQIVFASENIRPNLGSGQDFFGEGHYVFFSLNSPDDSELAEGTYNVVLSGTSGADFTIDESAVVTDYRPSENIIEGESIESSARLRIEYNSDIIIVEYQAVTDLVNSQLSGEYQGEFELVN